MEAEVQYHETLFEKPRPETHHHAKAAAKRAADIAGEDEALADLMLAWYYVGYYAGVYNEKKKLKMNLN